MHMRQVDTPYVFLCDMDFLPSRDLEHQLAKHLELLVDFRYIKQISG
jgi:hypothetical protein